MISRALAVVGVASLAEPSGSGGGGTTTPVTPPADVVESIAAGGALADVEWSAFGDTGGRIASYVLTTNNVNGSATMTGTGVGPYVIAGEADAEVLLATLDAKDSAGDIVASAYYTGIVAAAGGAAYSSIFDIDLTTVDSAGPWTTGDVTLTTDSTATDLINFTTTRNNGSSPGTIEAVNGTGVVILAGGNFSITGAFDLAAKIAAVSGSWGAAQYRGKTVLVQVCIEYANVNAGDGILVCFDTAKTALVESRGYRSDRASANETYEVRNDTTDTGVESATTPSSSGVISLYLVDAEVVWVDRTLGTLTPPAYGMSAAYRAGITVQNNNTAPRFGTDCNLCLVTVDDSTITVTRVLAGVME
tara:strand:+ start:689 stop:1771 length:1083 start_codon:yes stop_codon:yes gene_type:complete